MRPVRVMAPATAPEARVAARVADMAAAMSGAAPAAQAMAASAMRARTLREGLSGSRTFGLSDFLRRTGRPVERQATARNSAMAGSRNTW